MRHSLRALRALRADRIAAVLLLAMSLLLSPADPSGAAGDEKAGASEKASETNKAEAAKASGKEAGASEAAEEEKAPPPEFDVTYEMLLVASEKSAHVTIRLGKGAEEVEWIRLAFDPMRYRAIESDGTLEEVEGGILWKPRKGGGQLRYVFSIDHLRDEKAYDSRCAKSWAILRGQDLVPRIRIRTTPGAISKSRMRLRLPEGWSAALPYPRSRNGTYEINHERTRFDRPNGWFAFGKLGVVRETIGETKISIAGPSGQGVRRMDVLALLRWGMPELSTLFGSLPERLQVVVAGDPMWRGGLSGPNSVYLHVDRPLISQDSSSPLLHEFMHSLMHARSGPDGQWIVEGIAEYYSIELLRRSKTLSQDRFDAAMESLAQRAARSRAKLNGDMDGSARSKAVLAIVEIDEAIREATNGEQNLDGVVRALERTNAQVTIASLRAAMQEVAGVDFPALFTKIEAQVDRDKS
ncbi:MAG: hypothetical protein AB8G23_13255 [Myxococcota bacterium]